MEISTSSTLTSDQHIKALEMSISRLLDERAHFQSQLAIQKDDFETKLQILELRVQALVDQNLQTMHELSTRVSTREAERDQLLKQLTDTKLEIAELIATTESENLSRQLKKWFNAIAIATPFVITAAVSTPTVAGPAVALGCAATAINEATKPR